MSYIKSGARNFNCQPRLLYKNWTGCPWENNGVRATGVKPVYWLQISIESD